MGPTKKGESKGKKVDDASAGGDGSGSAKSRGEVLQHCEDAVKLFCKGSREKARQALAKVAKKFPDSELPSRYQARFYFHEAECLERLRTDEGKRTELIRLALEHSERAAQLAPSSRSCVILQVKAMLDLAKHMSEAKACVEVCNRALEAADMDMPLATGEPVIMLRTPDQGDVTSFDPDGPEDGKMFWESEKEELRSKDETLQQIKREAQARCNGTSPGISAFKSKNYHRKRGMLNPKATAQKLLKVFLDAPAQNVRARTRATPPPSVRCWT
mmetsp:Transcript_54210/g.172066  ORF Transcript_54210/g.172066 Transcript_54210/m.172066 type:complete len:273 (+) Transcript_54210:159-977(+)